MNKKGMCLSVATVVFMFVMIELDDRHGSDVRSKQR